MSPETIVLGTSALLFSTGTAGVLLRRNPIAILMSIELMLNAGNIVLVLASRARGTVDGQAAALLILVLAAAEAVVGLALALALFRNRERAEVDDPSGLRG